LLLFFQVSNTGKSQLLAISLVDKEEPQSFGKSVASFINHMNKVAPKTVILERHLKLYQAFKE
jgi:hypothetical protein